MSWHHKQTSCGLWAWKECIFNPPLTFLRGRSNDSNQHSKQKICLKSKWNTRTNERIYLAVRRTFWQEKDNFRAKRQAQTHNVCRVEIKKPHGPRLINVAYTKTEISARWNHKHEGTFCTCTYVWQQSTWRLWINPSLSDRNISRMQTQRRVMWMVCLWTVLRQTQLELLWSDLTTAFQFHFAHWYMLIYKATVLIICDGEQTATMFAWHKTPDGKLHFLFPLSGCMFMCSLWQIGFQRFTACASQDMMACKLNAR